MSEPPTGGDALAHELLELLDFREAAPLLDQTSS
jgi:hypothetical protein